MKKLQRGFTLIELMVVVAIVAIVAYVAVPSYVAFIENKRLVDSTEFIQGKLNFARAEAIKQSKVIYLGVTSGSSWDVGIGDQSSCDGSNSANCTVTTSVNGTDGVQIPYFYTDPGNGTDVTSAVQVRFDPVRGTASTSTITISNSAGALKVKVSLLGRIIICSDAGVARYPVCT